MFIGLCCRLNIGYIHIVFVVLLTQEDIVAGVRVRVSGGAAPVSALARRSFGRPFFVVGECWGNGLAML